MSHVGRPPWAAAGPLAGFARLPEFGWPGQGARRGSGGCRGADGFTLLEMIVATAVMSIAVVGLLSLLSGVLSNARRVKQYDQAAMLARTKMNDLLVISPLPLGQPLAGQFDESTGWKAVVTSFDRWPEAYPGSYELVRIDLEVWWTDREERKSVKLEGFRREIVR